MAKETEEPVQEDAIISRLDALISLLLKPVDGYSEQVGPLQKQILAFCDFEHTTEDICKSVKKTKKHVNKELSLLRGKGLVKTIMRDGRSVHLRV